MSDNQSDPPLSLTQQYEQATALIESDPAKAVDVLSELQHAVARATIVSSNEELDEIATNSLPLLAVEHSLALALLQLPTGPGQLEHRRNHLRRACDLWVAFLQRLESLSLLEDDKKAYEDLVDVWNTQSTDGQAETMPPASNREVKIARFQAQKEATNKRQQLQALLARRHRLQIAETDALDGHDEESLLRQLYLTELNLAKTAALEEWGSAVREWPMVSRMLASGPPTLRRPPPQKPLQVTQITQNPAGQLQFARQEIRSNVLRPGWNQPTMSLDELAEREVAAARERESRQAVAEAAQLEGPQKYERLVQEGLEDDADRVDQSAAVDRNWDDWKDANPRGSGNKRADVGDRNF